MEGKHQQNNLKGAEATSKYLGRWGEGKVGGGGGEGRALAKSHLRVFDRRYKEMYAFLGTIQFRLL